MPVWDSTPLPERDLFRAPGYDPLAASGMA
jgi:hypothetical protein